MPDQKQMYWRRRSYDFALEENRNQSMFHFYLLLLSISHYHNITSTKIENFIKLYRTINKIIIL